MILSVLLVLSLEVDQTLIKAEDIYLLKFASAASDDHRVLISGQTGQTDGLYLFDFETGKARLLDDGRMPVMLPYLGSGPAGFYLLDRITGKVHHTDAEGNYRSTDHLRDYAGYLKGYRIFKALPDGPDRMLVTFQKEDHQVLARLNFAEKTLVTLHRQDGGVDYHFWMSVGGRYYQVRSEDGSILQLDSEDFSKKTQIRPPAKPIRREKNRPGRRKYYAMLNNPVIIGDSASLRWYHSHDGLGNADDEVLFAGIRLGKDGIKVSDVIILGQWKDQRLVLDVNSMEVSLR